MNQQVTVTADGDEDQNDVFICTACEGEFDLDAEGGTVGDFGILPVAFCPTCLACMVDMVEQMYPERFGDEEE